MASIRTGQRRTRFVRVSMCSVLMIPVLLFSGEVSARNVGATGSTSCTGLNIPYNTDDPEYVRYHRSALTTVMSDAVYWAMVNDVNPTDLYSAAASSVASSTHTYYDDAYTTYCGLAWKTPTGGNVIGHAKCDALTGSACARHSLRFNTYYTNTASTTARRGLACHETGHGLGFTHPASGEQQNSCLASSSVYTNWSPAEISAINSIFY